MFNNYKLKEKGRRRTTTGHSIRKIDIAFPRIFSLCFLSCFYACVHACVSLDLDGINMKTKIFSISYKVTLSIPNT